MSEDTGKTGETAFTPVETSLLVAIMQNLTSDIQFDADKVAEIMGYKDGSIVKVRWGQIKRSKINRGNLASPAGVKKRATPKKGAKVKAEADGDDDEGVAAAETPVKTPAKRGRKPKKEGVEAAEGEQKVKDEEVEEEA